MNEFKRIRVEEPKPPKPTPVIVGRVVPIASPVTAPSQPPIVEDVAYWRALALKNGERLALAEAQARDLRQAADDARSRFSKYKTRLDAANARVNDLQVELTRKTAEHEDARGRMQSEIDQLRTRLGRTEVLRKMVYEFRQSILDGPIWAIFAELCNDVSADAGEEKKSA